MKLIFLGTSAGLATMHRNVTSAALQWKGKNGGVWLFDAGESTQHQLMRSSISVSMIDKIFITHLHGDHVFGLVGVLASRSMHRIERPLKVFGPLGIKEYIETVIRLTDSFLTYPLEIIEIQQEGVIDSDERAVVRAVPLKHRITCYGYRVEEKDRFGGLDTERLKAKGIPASTIWGQLQKGESVTLPTGEVLHSDAWSKPNIPGRIVSVFGDNYPTENNLRLAHRATVMVHEASYADDLLHKAQEYLHATFSQTATLAKEAEVQQLIITHISARYSFKQVEELKQQARHIFPHLEVAKDFDEYDIPEVRQSAKSDK